MSLQFNANLKRSRAELDFTERPNKINQTVTTTSDFLPCVAPSVQIFVRQVLQTVCRQGRSLGSAEEFRCSLQIAQDPQTVFSKSKWGDAWRPVWSGVNICCLRISNVKRRVTAYEIYRFTENSTRCACYCDSGSVEYTVPETFLFLGAGFRGIFISSPIVGVSF